MIFLNGRLVAAGEARIDPADRGLLLGKGGLFGSVLRVKSLSREHVVRELPKAQVQWVSRISWSGH